MLGWFRADARKARAAKKRTEWRAKGRATLAEAQRVADVLHEGRDDPFTLNVRLLLPRAEDWDKDAEEQAQRYIRRWQQEIEDREYDRKQEAQG